MDKNKEDVKTKNGNDVWKSLKEYYDDPEILKAKANEFKDGVTDDFDPSEMNGVSRRKFLALLTASAAFAVTACSDYPDKGKVIPYNKRPEGMLPGTADYYSSTCNGCSQGCGILVKTREGRPIKVDGNPDHPINQGKLCPTGQASILNLYDPERLTEPKINKRKASWEKVDQGIIDALNGAVADGKEISIVTNKINSPTTKKVLSDFKTKFPTTKLYTYDLLSDVNRRHAWIINLISNIRH
jgi:molybdopterin-containing oxidoreductase family iron-sulfur binding subunit